MNLLQKEKENLIQELDKAISEKLNIQKDLEITKQKLELNEFSIKNKTNIGNIASNNDLEIGKIIQEKNKEIKKLEEKISNYEKKNEDGGVGMTPSDNKKLVKDYEIS